MRYIETSALVIAAILVSACGPVAPSVSKLAGSAQPTDSNSPANNLNAKNTMRSDYGDGISIQETVVVSESEFSDFWHDVSVTKPSMEVSEQVLKDARNEFRKNRSIVFHSSDRRVTNSEATLAGRNSKIRVYLVVNGEKAKIKKQRLDHVRTSLVWHPKSKTTEAHWELEITEPNVRTGDGARDTNAENIRNALVERLVTIALEFDAEI